MLRLFTPDLRVDSVLDLTVDRLRELGLDTLLLDVDCTLKNYSAELPSPEVAAWLEGLCRAGVRLFLFSNGRPKRIGVLADRLGLPCVSKALKPLPFKCRGLVKRNGCDCCRTAVVGDQIFADVMVGRLAGLKTILVRPIHPEEEPWFTRLKRPFERILLRRWDRKPP